MAAVQNPDRNTPKPAYFTPTGERCGPATRPAESQTPNLFGFQRYPRGRTRRQRRRPNRTRQRPGGAYHRRRFLDDRKEQAEGGLQHQSLRRRRFRYVRDRVQTACIRLLSLRGTATRRVRRLTHLAGHRTHNARFADNHRQHVKNQQCDCAAHKKKIADTCKKSSTGRRSDSYRYKTDARHRPPSTAHDSHTTLEASSP